MDSKKDSVAKNVDAPAIGVIKVKIDSLDAPTLLTECINLLALESQSLPGFVAAHVLLSVDHTTVVILTEWSDRHAWARSRYDVRVGEIMDKLMKKSTTMELEVYTRQAEFRGPVS